jgi:predicted TIM-barrel fold metal-dependent hydrolase
MSHFTGLIDFRSHFYGPRSESLQGDQGLDSAAALEQQLSKWMHELQTHAIDHIVAYASRPGEAPGVSAAAKAAGGRLIPFALVDPATCDAKQRAEELLGRYKFRGFLLFPSAHGYSIDGPKVEGLFEVAGSVGAPVVVHCGLLAPEHREQLALPKTLDLNLGNPLSIIPVATRFPETTFVIPHFGAGFFRETLMAGEMCENIFVDSSSSNHWIRTQSADLGLEDVFERALGVFGPERILFGTGSTPSPRAWRHDLFTIQREALGALEVSVADQSLIFRDNARRLLGLDS